MKRLGRLSNSCLREIERVSKYEYLKKGKGKVNRRVKGLREKISYYDCLMLDITHSIEFADVQTESVASKIKSFNKINDVMNSRRKMKDLLSFYAIVQLLYKEGLNRRNYNKYLKRVRNFVNRCENRIYKSRVEGNESA